MMAGSDRLLVHSMGTELTAPDWAPLTGPEVGAVLACYPSSAGDAQAEVAWPSPRPLSAAALVRRGGEIVFVKRHHRSVRTAAQLAPEHAFAAHLRAHGLPGPVVRPTRSGATAVTRDTWVYEVHDAAPGLDLYRDAMSWTPFRSAGHARAAGAMLARLHLAAASFDFPARPPGVLLNASDVEMAADPLAAVSALATELPGLGRYLAARAWRADLARHLLPAIERAAPLLAALPAQWGHGDWHPSNLTWTEPDGPEVAVAAVLDLGLANRTSAAHDLATALERSAVSWLDLPVTGHARADLDGASALLDGYQRVRPLGAGERNAVAAVLPVVHLEFALSEIAYFTGVTGSAANADLAYDGYLIGHAAWFSGPEASALVELVRG